MEYDEENMLMLSGIQHYMFCPRQWALIHIEQQWEDNRLTIEGQLLHTNVDNPSYRQKNGEKITLHSLHIASKRLGLYGITDAVELIPSNSPNNSITHATYPGYWHLLPIEYKRGHSKSDKSDEVQLVAQIICLEEMHNIKIEYGALFYGETKHRKEIIITDELREQTFVCAKSMHDLYNKGISPKAIKKPYCKNCSLYDLCIPELNDCFKVSNYLIKLLNEEIT